MTISQFPASGLGGSDKWVEISSTSASGSTVTFSSISGYRKLAILLKAVATTSGSGSSMYVQINGDTGTNYNTAYTNNVSGFSVLANQNDGMFFGYASSANTNSGLMVIDNADSETIKLVSGWFCSSLTGGLGLIHPESVYKGSATISSLSVKTGITFGSGTITVYGVKS